MSGPPGGEPPNAPPGGEPPGGARPRIRTARDDAVLVELPGRAAAARLHRSLRDAPLPGTGPPVAGARTVLVPYDPASTTPGLLAAALRARAAAPSSGSAGEPRRITVPTVFDGTDLDDVAAHLGCSATQVVRRVTTAAWTVAFMGFAPGFGYLVGDDPGLVVPRRRTPRTRVPAGSVALAGEHAGVYPREGPGGWQLVGRTELAVWDLRSDPPAVWAPGDEVRFEAVRSRAVAARAPAPPVSLGSSGFDRQVELPIEARAAERSDSARSGTAGAGAVEVVDAGPLALVQDLGRPGRADQGVATAGAADPRSLRAAHRAVGNPPDAAAVETVGGLRLRARTVLVVAVAGAQVEVWLHPADGPAARPVPPSSPVALAPGDELTVGHPTRGVRAYVAVRGGLLADPVLGSRSTDTLGGLGPAPLSAGDLIGVGPAPGGAVATDDVGAPDPAALPAPGETVHLPVVLGPRDDWFTPAALDALLDQEWEVTARADRVGLRLDGATPLERTAAASGRELPSEGCVTGALQVPADGRPVLFGPDHPVTGGYPVVGAVVAGHLWRLGQLPPGARLRLHRA